MGALFLTALHVSAGVYVLPPINADDALDGLTAFEVLRGEFPVWLHYWQWPMSYHGAIQGYLEAPLLALFGPTDWVLRVWPFLLRLGGAVLASWAIGLLLGRRAAVLGLLLVGLWPHKMHFTLLQAQQKTFCVFLWYALLWCLVRSIDSDRRPIRAALSVGALCGLALWCSFQSLLIILPVGFAYLLCTHGMAPLRKRGSALLVSFFVGSLPWWHYNLFVFWMGSFLENQNTRPPQQADLAALLQSAFENWRYYVAHLLPLLMEPRLLPSGDKHTWLGSALAGLVVLVAAAFLVKLRWTCSAPHSALSRLVRRPEEAGPLTREARISLFWWLCVVGIALLWLAGVGFTFAGTKRNPEQGVHYPQPMYEAYLAPVFILLPFVVSFLVARLKRPWSRLGYVLVALLLMPAAWEVANFGERLERRDRALEHVQLVLEQLRRSGAGFLVGGYWEVGSYRYWSSDRLATACFESAKQLAFAPTPWPADKPGLLLLQRGSAHEQEVEERWGLGSYPELEAPPGYRLHRIDPALDPLGMFASLQALWRFQEDHDRFDEGELQELVLGPGLLTMSAERLVDPEAGVSFRSRRTGDYLVYGTYRSLRPGLYSVRFNFEPPQPKSFEVVADVFTPYGDRTMWAQTRRLSKDGGLMQGFFEVSSPRKIPYETRLFLTSATGPVVLSEVRLRRVQLDSDEARAAAVDRVRAQFHDSFERFREVEVDEVLLNAGLFSASAQVVVDGKGGIVYRGAKAGEFLVFGPYVRLQPGLYEVGFVFSGCAGMSCRVRVEVAREAGRQIVWTESSYLLAGETALWGRFEVARQSEELYETRVVLEEAQGPVSLSRVILRRVAAVGGIAR